jgi:hypothetical protein
VVLAEPFNLLLHIRVIAIYRHFWGLTEIMKWAFWDNVSWMVYERYELDVWEKIKILFQRMLHNFSDGFSISIQAGRLPDVEFTLFPFWAT